MAERRMFAKTIIDSDSFLDMPLSAQCLYFHLSRQKADDWIYKNIKQNGVYIYMHQHREENSETLI